MLGWYQEMRLERWAGAGPLKALNDMQRVIEEY